MKINLFKKTRLKVAIIRNDINVVKNLVNRECPTNIKIGDDTAVIYAIKNRHFKIASILIGNGANIMDSDIDNYTALHYAFFNQDTPFYIIRALIAHGADVNSRSYIGRTPLQLACLNGDLMAMNYLIRKGADVFETDMFGNTLMHIACTNNYNLIIQYLINKGLDLYSKNNMGVTAYTLLTNSNNLSLGANSEKNEMYTPLRKDSMRNLIKPKFVVPKRYESLAVHKRPLYTLSRNKSFDSIGSISLDLNSISKKNLNRLLCEACKTKNLEYAKYLIDLGADITWTDFHESNILLTTACKNNDIKMIKLLISKGLNIYDRNILAQSPINLLPPESKKEIVTYILQNSDANKINELLYNSNIPLDEKLYIINIDYLKDTKLKRIKTAPNRDLPKSNITIYKNPVHSISLDRINMKKSNPNFGIH